MGSSMLQTVQTSTRLLSSGWPGKKAPPKGNSVTNASESKPAAGAPKRQAVKAAVASKRRACIQGPA